MEWPSIFLLVNGHLTVSFWYREFSWLTWKVNMYLYLIDHFNFQYRQSCHLQYFVTSFLIIRHFIYLSCFTLLAKTSGTVLKRNGHNSHTCFVPIFKRNVSIFHHVMFWLFASYVWFRKLSSLLNWSIVGLQCCVNFCCIAKWFRLYIYYFSYIFSIMLYHMISNIVPCAIQ